MNSKPPLCTGTRAIALALASLSMLGSNPLLAQTSGTASPFTPQVLLRFSGSAGDAPGARPYTPPVVSADGSALLGTTLAGGPAYSVYGHEQSVAYRLLLDGLVYTSRVLDVDYGHQFTNSVLDSAGTLWAGAMQATSSANAGTFFSLAADGQPALGAAPDATLISATGFSPKGQAAIDGQSNVYFSSGLQAAACTPANSDTSNTLWRRNAAGKIERIVRFCDFLEQAGVDSRNNPIYRHVKGGLPVALIWSETDQALYGLTQVTAAGVDPSLPADDNDGKSAGTLFRIAKTALDSGVAAGDGDKIEVLHTFAQNRDGVPTISVTLVSGDSRASSLVEDGEWLYGTTYQASSSTAPGGTVWRVRKTDPASFAVIHTFHSDASQDGTDQADGSQPMGPLVRAADGNIYGTTSRDSRSLSGTVAIGAGALFRVRVGQQADRGDDQLEILHRFDMETEGGRPVGLSAGPVVDGVQKLYGATRFGGADGDQLGTAATSTGGHGALFAVELALPSVSFTTPLSVSATTAKVGDALRLSWAAENAESCTAGGSNGGIWTGAQQTSGSEVPLAALTQSGVNTFTLSCASVHGGPAAEATVSVTVEAAATPTDPDGGDTGGGGGGGPLGPWLLAPLAGLALLRRRIAS
ncbi:hypothetical protein PIGHUM_00376 [Pigmentiphaga humi]|uniref:Ig-like domain-containing protein n=1 Tax=Pigmentiphaga humi TaxID=2478468 RepID=A0A3P4AZQ4_9BURK|nr:choice-of-anchor tandem repeat GloVer-containing protein [Pigmentiphaga humi]VCU68325.1 hypothetical protein PIGHUM_00376 [Pigmentiphaga humi]